MGINNIHILTEPDRYYYRTAQQAQAEGEAVLIAAHRRGEHPWEAMRKDCPLCQADK